MEWWIIILIVASYLILYFISSFLFSIKIKFLSIEKYQLAGLSGAGGIFISFALYGFATYSVVILSTWWAFLIFVLLLCISSFLSTYIIQYMENKNQKKLQLEKENYI